MNLPEPLDPDSPKGKEVAARLSEAITEVRAAIAARRARRLADERAAARNTTTTG